MNYLSFMIPPQALLPYEKEIRDRIANNGHKGLIDNLQKFFTDSELLRVITLYHLGSIDHRWVVYPYIDVDCRLRSMKTIRYYVDGHRARSKSAVSSLHALLKEEAILPAQWKEHLEKMDVENNTDIADLFLSDNRKHFIKEFTEYINSIGQIGLAK